MTKKQEDAIKKLKRTYYTVDQILKQDPCDTWKMYLNVLYGKSIRRKSLYSVLKLAWKGLHRRSQMRHLLQECNEQGVSIENDGWPSVGRNPYVHEGRYPYLGDAVVFLKEPPPMALVQRFAVEVMCGAITWMDEGNPMERKFEGDNWTAVNEEEIVAYSNVVNAAFFSSSAPGEPSHYSLYPTYRQLEAIFGKVEPDWNHRHTHPPRETKVGHPAPPPKGDSMGWKTEARVREIAREVARWRQRNSTGE
jgi:hypothetical protein